MYTEVRELVNFVCRYLFGHIPRRPVGIFGAELGNYLVSHFSSTWDVNHPKNGEMKRMINTTTSLCFASSAEEAGVPPSDVLRLLPTNMIIFANPGHVFVRLSENGIETPIWIGDVNADENYQSVPEYVVRTAAIRAEHHHHHH
uniref:FOG-3 protein n=1 Tax=Caenorhabditis elegans TaxID=6239 RepID=UPI000BB3E6A0|nr:Chain A, FOG-3 protein [Caenorhabditis elegans]5TD6_B Chain B, FOG-3 protein [Caenorhabditis elegans]